MSLEDLIKANTAALEANTAALKGVAAGSTSSTKTTSTSSKKDTNKVKVTKEQAVTALTKLKDDFTDDKKGLVAAKEILGRFGFPKMADITDDKAGDVLDAANEAYESLKAAAESAGDDL